MRSLVLCMLTCSMSKLAGVAATLDWEVVNNEAAVAKADPAAVAGDAAGNFVLPDDVADGDDDLEWDDV